MSTRFPLCHYYSSDPSELRREIEWCRTYYDTSNKVDRALFPHNVDYKAATSQQQHNPILLVPHGALCDSGPLVADAFQNYLMLPKNSNVDNTIVVILIGTEHASRSRHKVYCSNFQCWVTPLGPVNVHPTMLESLLEFLPVDNSAFVDEHSIENQLPVLQSVLGEFSMLAINIHGYIEQGDLDTIRFVATKLADTIRHGCAEKDTVVAVVATTDYTHAGPGYCELPPPTSNYQSISDYIRAQDQGFLDVLCTKSDGLAGAEELWKSGNKTSMCGLGATLLTTELARHLGKSRARLLKYAVGSDICDRGLQDQTGFATVVFE